jgi:hypothetical protein
MVNAHTAREKLPADLRRALPLASICPYEQDVATLQRLLDAYSADMNGLLPSLRLSAS